MTIAELRREYHERLCNDIIRISPPASKRQEYPNFADGANATSIAIAWKVIANIGFDISPADSTTRQESRGAKFELITQHFLDNAFCLLNHIRPGRFEFATQRPISLFYQYEHLALSSQIEELIVETRKTNSDLAILLTEAIGQDYVVKPDIVVGRFPVADDEINRQQPVIAATESAAKLTPLRSTNWNTSEGMILHASISCKWTIRSDRSQNTRTEALNLIRNRKGPLPHILAVTAEPLPTRIASLAMGTGDLDCVYHFALPELRQAVADIQNEDQLEVLDTLIEGRRLRDISDLPFDIAI
jgi:hypothetical protein